MCVGAGGRQELAGIENRPTFVPSGVSEISIMADDAPVMSVKERMAALQRNSGGMRIHRSKEQPAEERTECHTE